MGHSPAVEIAMLESPQGPDLRAIAALSFLAWGRQPSEAEIEKRVGRFEAEASGLDPASRPVFFVARKSGRLVGFGRVARDRNDPDNWWLFGLAVHPDHRRRGIGRALAVARIAYARAHGATVIRSETHLDNEASARFHEAVGFRNDGQFTASDGDRKITFRMVLADC